MEIWKDIEGYEGLYKVSNLGRVKSLNYNHTGKEKILRPKKERNGYLRVNLYKNGKNKMFTVHRLVAEAFLENPDNLPQINHKNEIKTDNSVNNLEFCTSHYNMTYKDKHLRIAKKVGCFRDGKLIKIYPSLHSVELDGFYECSVCRCCLNRYGYKSSGGFQWNYLE